jgi:adenosylmethionine-8-amino-7-oxononanoate aminotransferase
MNALKTRLVEQGVWVRPFRDIVYLTPAFTIQEDELTQLTGAIYRALNHG